MKKSLTALLLIGALFMAGCTPEQKQAIAKQAGIIAAVTWLGYDNPSPDEINSVKTIVNIIKQYSATNCESYFASVYPIVDAYITDHVEANQQPITRVGAGAILGGLDTFFAAYPSLKSDVSLATSIVNSFCDGAVIGLNMLPSDPVRIAATRQAGLRAGLRLR